MKFSGIRKCAVLAALVGSLGLASCGGGEQVEPFAPVRMLSFGDENSVIDTAGRKYTINALNPTSGAIDCARNPIWNQSVAQVYNLVFPECNPANVAAPASRIYALPGAKVADFTAQIDAFTSSGGVFGSRDLVTVSVGENDVFELFALYPGQTQLALQAEIKARGVVLGQQINRIAGLGGRVVVGALQELQFTPFGRARTGPEQDLIKGLTLAFNDGFLTTLDNAGKQVGLFYAAASLNEIAIDPGWAALGNASNAACQTTATLPNCNDNTLVPGAAPLNWLWADDRHLSPAGHQQIGTLAYDRAKNNPF